MHPSSVYIQTHQYEPTSYEPPHGTNKGVSVFTWFIWNAKRKLKITVARIKFSILISYSQNSVNYKFRYCQYLFIVRLPHEILYVISVKENLHFYRSDIRSLSLDFHRSKRKHIESHVGYATNIPSHRKLAHFSGHPFMQVCRVCTNDL